MPVSPSRPAAAAGPLAAAEAAVLTASTVDLVRRAAAVHVPAAAVPAPYAAWTAFAASPSTAIARRN